MLDSQKYNIKKKSQNLLKNMKCALKIGSFFKVIVVYKNEN